jgi:AcrR family transcriptional regulator
MTASTGTRREPVQERSRRTVTKILQATEQIIGESGIEAATTRAVSERAGVAAPSLYRFFADRDEILDALLEQLIKDLDQHVQTAETTEQPRTIEQFIVHELDIYADFYKTHPTAAALWFGGRASPAVTQSIRERNHTLANRMRALLIDHQLVHNTTPPAALELLVELGDRILEVAFRDPAHPNAEPLQHGKTALTVYLQHWATT